MGGYNTPDTAVMLNYAGEAGEAGNGYAVVMWIHRGRHGGYVAAAANYVIAERVSRVYWIRILKLAEVGLGLGLGID